MRVGVPAAMSDVLTGRQALITGASQGLGLAIARAFLTSGASVFICGRDTATLERAQAELAPLCGAGQEVAAQPADVADPDEVESLVKRRHRALPRALHPGQQRRRVRPQGLDLGRRLA